MGITCSTWRLGTTEVGIASGVFSKLGQATDRSSRRRKFFTLADMEGATSSNSVLFVTTAENLRNYLACFSKSGRLDKETSRRQNTENI